MPGFKAIEVDSATRRRTGREHALVAVTRSAAVDELIVVLEVKEEEVRIDPSRTLVQVGAQLWTLVSTGPAQEEAVQAPLRRAGAKHKRVR